MADKTYTLKLTGDQLWALSAAYDASFTDPDSQNKHEKAVKRKLDTLIIQRHEDKKR